MDLPKIILSALFFTACASPKKDLPDPTPQPLPTSTNPAPVHNLNSDQYPRALVPIPKTDMYFPLPADSGMSGVYGAAMFGVMAGIAQIFSANEPRTDLNGTCVYGVPEDPVSVSPCINVQVHLFKKQNEILASTSTNQKGEFRFFIPKGEKYFVQITDRKGRSASTAKEAGRSEMVSIFLKP